MDQLEDNLIGDTKMEQDQFVKILTNTNLINFINSDKNGINKILESWRRAIAIRY